MSQIVDGYRATEEKPDPRAVHERFADYACADDDDVTSDRAIMTYRAVPISLLDTGANPLGDFINQDLSLVYARDMGTQSDGFKPAQASLLPDGSFRKSNGRHTQMGRVLRGFFDVYGELYPTHDDESDVAPEDMPTIEVFGRLAESVEAGNFDPSAVTMDVEIGVNGWVGFHKDLAACNKNLSGMTYGRMVDWIEDHFHNVLPESQLSLHEWITLATDPNVAKRALGVLGQNEFDIHQQHALMTLHMWKALDIDAEGIVETISWDAHFDRDQLRLIRTNLPEDPPRGLLRRTHVRTMLDLLPGDHERDTRTSLINEIVVDKKSATDVLRPYSTPHRSTSGGTRQSGNLTFTALVNLLEDVTQGELDRLGSKGELLARRLGKAATRIREHLGIVDEDGGPILSEELQKLLKLTPQKGRANLYLKYAQGTDERDLPLLPLDRLVAEAVIRDLEQMKKDGGTDPKRFKEALQAAKSHI